VVTALALLGVVVVLFAAAALATRDDPLLRDAPPDAADLALPPGRLEPTDVSGVRFEMTLRGYRMSQVDEALARLADELRLRDERIAELERDRSDA
jgi:DivIVA domain-containing protein